MAAEATLFTFETLSKGAEGTTRAMTGRGNAGDFIIEESSDMVLEEFPEIFDNEVRGAGFNVFAKTLINANGIDELVSEIILGADACFEDNRRADRDGGDGEDG